MTTMKRLLLLFLLFYLTEGIAQTVADTTTVVLKGYPVVLNDDTVFFVYKKIGSMTAEERAERIAYKFKNLIRQTVVKADSIKVIETESTSDIVYIDYIITGVSDAEAQYEHKSRQLLAAERAAAIKAAFSKNERLFNLKELAFRISTLILILTVLYFFIKIGRAHV